MQDDPHLRAELARSIEQQAEAAVAAEHANPADAEGLARRSRAASRARTGAVFGAGGEAVLDQGRRGTGFAMTDLESDSSESPGEETTSRLVRLSRAPSTRRSARPIRSFLVNNL